MIRSFSIWVLITIMFFSCQFNQKKSVENHDLFQKSTISKPISFDLDAIKTRDTLRAIVLSGPTSFFVYKGESMGFEYDLLQQLAKELNLSLEIIVAPNFNVLGEWLNSGKGDIVAHNFTPTKTRKEKFTFTNYLYLTKQVLVQRKPDNWRNLKLHQIENMLITDAIDLIGDTVNVRKYSSYKMRLENFMEETGGHIHINEVDATLTTDELIGMVAAGDLKYTIADNTIAEMHAIYFKNIDVSTPISLSQKASWVIRRNAPQLQKALNTWIQKLRKTTDYYVIYNRYFQNSRIIKKHVNSDYYLTKTKQLSPYDDLIKKYSENLPWDWVMLASQIFQESRFDPKAQSWAKAQGLMQIMPSTARELGIEDTSHPEESIKAGTFYLLKLWNKWDTVEDFDTRLKYTLASYNAGLNHLKDAVTLTKAEGLDPNHWQNIEASLLKLTYRKYFSRKDIKYGYIHGIEPVNYVKEIFERYNLYIQLLDTAE
ncbi:transporter substrate-binding domain-containing protein [Tamlana fucoidanivorans]|uniref:Transporter substrate-binding domain-containing protein n=1 Tax=Allotamlana fucoidanivorans TaxID=2583814 RepID=A0A5C4SS02_9FLAO|nr:transporter substrate-binding domain-containing protein [Tamlana fucoidanivorans]TNJ46609.1 transporter substrate-binding domain-containing protein [Tamlana fucoidanivorans]